MKQNKYYISSPQLSKCIILRHHDSNTVTGKSKRHVYKDVEPDDTGCTWNACLHSVASTSAVWRVFILLASATHSVPVTVMQR